MTGEPVVHVVVPAHNEQAGIGATLDALAHQTLRPTTVTVVADNCTDDTVAIAGAYGVRVVETVDNTDKKAGALNQVLRDMLPRLGTDDLVFVQDADSVLAADFLEHAARYLTDNPALGAVGGTFRAQQAERREGATDPVRALRDLVWNGNARLLRHLQDNEYARYARDVRRLRGKCLVVTGTAAMFRAATLQGISRARLAGELPAGDGNGGVYDTTVLTEDNELSFAIMHLGYQLLAPPECLLTTEAMSTWGELWRQRHRWKRGAVENCFQYGWTSLTRPYWGRQLLTMIGVVITALYLMDVTMSLAFADFRLQPLWLAVTLIFCLERFITLSDKGIRRQAPAFLMYELPYDLFLQAVHAKAYLDSMTRTEKKW